MNASGHLLDLYDQWKKLTESEGAAIGVSNWIEVRRCQQSKQKLQPQIIRASDHMKEPAPSASALDPRLRDCVNQLIQLENNNSAQLALRIKSAKQEIDGLECTTQRLRQIHKSYVPSQGPVWNQYS